MALSCHLLLGLAQLQASFHPRSPLPRVAYIQSRIRWDRKSFQIHSSWWRVAEPALEVGSSLSPVLLASLLHQSVDLKTPCQTSCGLNFISESALCRTQKRTFVLKREVAPFLSSDSTYCPRLGLQRSRPWHKGVSTSVWEGDLRHDSREQ